MLLLRHLFQSAEINCDDAADADDSGELAITDAIFSLNYLFLSGDAPPFPLTHCSRDLTEDALDCERFEACEPVIEFYGQQFTGDAYLFVLDRSGSMQDGGELERMRQEVQAFIDQLSDSSEFSITWFDANVSEFPMEEDRPAQATEENKDAAAEWMSAISAGAGSCTWQGLESALEFAMNSQAERKTIILVGDGAGTCRGANEANYLNQMIQRVTEENGGRSQINVIGVLMGLQIDSLQMRAQAMRELAERNGGTFTRVN